jgi:L-iditol 2-dehydrogenase
LYDLLASYTEGRGADAAIITVAGAHPLQQAIASIRKGGTVNIFAAHSGTVPLNVEQLYHQELSLTSTYSSSPEDLRLGLDLIATREVRVDRLITHRLTLAQFAEGVALMRKHMAIKVYFRPDCP